METLGTQSLKSRHNLLDTIQAAFLLTDIHAKILYANRQIKSLFGYEREEMEGQRVRILFLEDDLVFFLPNILYLTRDRDGFDGEALLKRKDGTKVFVRLFTTSFREEGEVFLTFAFQEIQHLKKLEREKLEFQRWESLGRMVEEIAHQVRNPIVSIGGYTQRLRKTSPSSSKGQTYLDQILQETRKLERMIQRVEDYVHIPQPAFERESVQSVVEGALQPIAKEAMEEGVSFVVETEGIDGDLSIFIDRNLIARALSQVLRNSLETIQPSRGRKKRESVKITLLDEGESVGISITDRGEGISRKQLPLVFEPFFSTRPDHVGLGLTLVKKVMEEHGGSVRLESRLKKGTTVTLFFPKDRRRKIRRELISPEATEMKSG